MPVNTHSLTAAGRRDLGSWVRVESHSQCQENWAVQPTEPNRTISKRFPVPRTYGHAHEVSIRWLSPLRKHLPKWLDFGPEPFLTFEGSFWTAGHQGCIFSF